MTYKLLTAALAKPTKVDVGGGFDGGPEGGYVPQMSTTDAQRWKAKQFNLGKENARIELRKTFSGVNNGQGSTQVTMFVALDGWDFASKSEHRTAANADSGWFHNDTRGLNVRMSMNGPLLMTFDQFREIEQIVFEAELYLKEAKAAANSG
jgi:hypothetical protein